jgi:hypothetical protein
MENALILDPPVLNFASAVALGALIGAERERRNCEGPARSSTEPRQGEIRDRTAEGQYYRMAGLNLLAAIIIYWNTKHLGHAVAARHRAGLECCEELLAHISPLGWAHILLTGEYRWKK